MLTKDHLLRRSAVLLTLVASTGIAAADDQASEDKAPEEKPSDSADKLGEESCAPECPKAEPPPAAQAEPQPMTQPTYEPRYEEARVEDPLSRYGLEMALGGGVEGFTGQSARDFTNDGGGWNVRVGIGNKSPIGFEASYIGSAQSISALGLDNNTVLVGNGVEGLVRVNFTQGIDIKPFAFAGAAWRHYSLANESFNTSDVANSDNVLEIPMGAGIGYTYRGFMFDARGEFRIATQEDLLPSLTPSAANDKANLDRYGVSANVGYAF